MFASYPACFFKDEIGYSVVFPDLDYLATQGAELEAAISMAMDCLAGHIYILEKEGKPIPESSDISNIKPEQVLNELGLKKDEVKESFVNIVSVDVDVYARAHFEKAVKKTLTIPAWLNRAAIERNINFSQVLQEALKKQLDIR